MDRVDIKKKLYPQIEKVSNRYSYLSIPERILDSMVDDILDQFLKESNSTLNGTFNNYFIEKLDQYFKGYIKYQLINHNDHIINDFIECNINKKRGINELVKIEKLFREIDYEADTSTYADIIKRNSILNEMVQKFLKKNQKKLQQGQLVDLVDENTLFIIESYCLENKISLGKQTEEELDASIHNLEERLDMLEKKGLKHQEYEEDLEYVNIDIQRQYIKEVRRVSKRLLTKDEEKELSKRIALKDQEARKILAEANLRLVLSIAPKFQNRGLSLLDLIQSGNEGLMKAVDHFDPKKGSFSTCANIWIRQSILYAIYNTSRTIRFPVGLIHKIRNL